MTEYKNNESQFKNLQSENQGLREYIIHLQSRLLDSQGGYPDPPPNLNLARSTSTNHAGQGRAESKPVVAASAGPAAAYAASAAAAAAASGTPTPREDAPAAEPAKSGQKSHFFQFPRHNYDWFEITLASRPESHHMDRAEKDQSQTTPKATMEVIRAA